MHTPSLASPSRRSWLAAGVALAATAAVAAPGAFAAPSAAAAPAPKQLAGFDHAGAVSSVRGFVALTVGDGDTRTLYVGHPGAIAPAKNVGALPAWARPHLGIDALQRTVVVYPRCTASPENCDLYSYAVLGGVERKIQGVNTTANELEGTYDHGTLAFTRTKGSEALQAGDVAITRSLLLSGRKSGTPRLISSSGGEQLALRGTRLVQMRDASPTAGSCGKPTVELFDTRSRARTTIDATVCGPEFETVGSPAIVGNVVVWTWSSKAKGGFVLQERLPTGVRAKAPLPSAVESYAATGLNAGIALTSGAEGGTDQRLLKLRGLAFTAAPAPGH